MHPMAAVWMAARTQLRRRWGATIALVLLVGLTGGAVLAAVAGASRTDSAMKRFVKFSRPEDAYVVVNGPVAPGTETLTGPAPDTSPAQTQVFIDKLLADRERLVRLPQVAEAGRAPYMFLSPDKDGKELGAVNAFAPVDGHAFRTLDRPRILRGRLARLDRAAEAVVDDVTARLRPPDGGRRLTLWSYAPQTNNNAATNGYSNLPSPDGPAYTFRIVGV